MMRICRLTTRLLGPASGAADPVPGRTAVAQHARAAMTLVELMLSVAIASAVLGVLVLVSASLRAGIGEDRTRQVLLTLHDALATYRQTHETDPAGHTHEVIKLLFEDAATAPILESLSRDQTQDSDVVRDGYGRPVRYLPPAPDVSLPGDFVSAGPDRRFGDPASDQPDDRRAAIDNLYGSDMEAPTP